MVNNKQKYAPPRSLDRVNAEGDIVPGDWRDAVGNNLQPLENASGNPTKDAKSIRQEYEQYFVTEGEVPWQYKHL